MSVDGDGHPCEAEFASWMIQPHSESNTSRHDAIVLIGAQAVYLRTIGRLPTYQPSTTDADLVLDPSKLLPIPPLGWSMSGADFVLTDEPGI